MRKQLYISLIFCLTNLMLLQHQPCMAQAFAYLPPPPYQIHENDRKELKMVLHSLENKFGVYFTFQSNLILNKYIRSEVKITNNLEESLINVLGPVDLSFKKLSDKYYTIYRKEETQEEEEDLKNDQKSQSIEQKTGESSFAKSIITSPLPALRITISGTVTDENSESLPGVNVIEKGTTNGTTTDASGNYTLDVEGENSRLIFSFIGYTSQEVLLNGNSTINITLAPSIQSLDEVVVVGFGTQRKINVTGSVSSVDAKTLEGRAVMNVGQALQGIVPGLNITQKAGGNLSNEPEFNIRGISTIGTGSSGSPLILIDGMQGDINTLNPQDIDNISVLKDAASSSIYGSRAPFGVILITTKRGKAGKPTVNYSNSFRWNSPILIPKQMDSYTFALYFNDGGYNKGQGAIFNDIQLKRIQDFQAGIITATNVPNPSNPQFWGFDMEPNDNIDWYDVMYKDVSPSMEHTFNVSGGNENVDYYISGNYLSQNGLMELTYDKYKRYNLTTKINAKLSSWASLSYSGRWGRYDVDEPSWLTKAFNFNLDQGRRAWPTWPLYDPNGYMYQLGRYDFPVGMKYGGRSKEQQDWIYQQFRLTLEPIKGWKIFGELNYNVTDSFDNWNQLVLYNHDVDGNPVVSVPTSRVQEDAARSNFLNPNIYTEYLKTFNDHELKVMVGMQSELSKSRRTAIRRDGIIVPELPVLNATSGTDINGKPINPVIAGAKDQWATVGFFGRINYDYKGRYLVEANMRYDGTSRFRADQRWNYFPSVSLGWNVARESFWRNLDKSVNTLKIRGSYGILGNQNTTNLYPTYVTMPVGIGNGSWLLGGARPNTASIPGLISSVLTWEKVKAYNIGADLGFFEDRLTTTFDYFVRFTNNMVGPAPELPVSLGRPVPITNNTDLKTYGFEFDLTWQDRLKNNLGYNIHLLLFDSQTEILKYSNPTGNLNTFREGQMMGEIWGYRTMGIAKTQQEMDEHLASMSSGGQIALGSNWQAGDIMYQDTNGDGKIDPGATTVNNHGDLTIIGNSTPRYSFGLDLGADWKGFDFRAFFQGVIKKEFFQNSNYFWGIRGSMWSSTGFVEHGDYFRNDPEHPLGLNVEPYFPRPIFDDNKNQAIQTRYLQNGAYLRLKNLQIGYTIPQRITNKVGAKNFRIYVSGENIWTRTKLTKIFDPETIDGGSGGNVYPLSKVYSFGVMLTL